MDTVEDLARELEALRRRVDAAEGVLQIQELKARYGELVDARAARAVRSSRPTSSNGSGATSPHSSPRTVSGTVAPPSAARSDARRSRPASPHPASISHAICS